MTISQLECFTEAASLGSFSAAGAKLFISQQAVSRQISSLEKELGFSLFERKNNGVILTEKGQLFFREEKELLQRHHTIIQKLRNMTESAGMSIHIGIGAFSTFDQQNIIETITSFAGENPDFNVEYANIPMSMMEDYFAGGKVNFILSYKEELKRSRNLSLIEIGKTSRSTGIIIAKSNPLSAKKYLTPADLTGATWGVMSKTFSLNHVHQVKNALAQMGIFSPKLAVYSSKINLQIALAADRCLTISYDDIVQGFQNKIKSYPLEDNNDISTLCLGWKNPGLDRIARKLATYLKTLDFLI